jgi:hypothetical protein
MQRTIPLSTRIFLVLLLLALPLILDCKIHRERSPENVLDALLHFEDLQLIDTVALQFATHHVQGLELTERYYFVSSVDREQRQGWLYKIERQGTRLHSNLELTDGPLIHPGGMQWDGQYLWIPNAEYRRESRTIIYGVDPNSLKIGRSFSVDDHIGAVASDGKQFIYGVNWDALHFYAWNFNGDQLSKVDSPTSMAYQDIKYVAGKLLCSGHKDGDSVIDVIDPSSWMLVKRIDLPRDVWKSALSREGMAFDGKLYFLPDDGPDSHILIFALD